MLKLTTTIGFLSFVVAIVGGAEIAQAEAEEAAPSAVSSPVSPAPVAAPTVGLGEERVSNASASMEAAASTERAPAANEGEPVCVSVSKTNLRASPSTSAKVTWVVGRNMPLQRMGREAGWSKVRDLRGQTHWVISKNLSANESCAVVRVRTATLHKIPRNPERADFRQADRYTPFKKTDREGGWVRLEDEYKGSFWTRDTNVWIPVRRSRMSF